jgi:hypothetical protein
MPSKASCLLYLIQREVDVTDSHREAVVNSPHRSWLAINRVIIIKRFS